MSRISPVDFAAELQKKGKPSELVQISGNGKNAADFHMAFYLGQLASKDPDAYFHVISKDTGFAPLISHLKEKHQLRAKRWLQIGDIPWVNIAKAKSDDERARLIIAKLREAKSGLPATRKALATFICVNFFKRLSDESVARIVSVMERLKAIAFNGEKITYAL